MTPIAWPSRRRTRSFLRTGFSSVRSRWGRADLPPRPDLSLREGRRLTEGGGRRGRHPAVANRNALAGRRAATAAGLRAHSAADTAVHLGHGAPQPGDRHVLHTGGTPDEQVRWTLPSRTVRQRMAASIWSRCSARCPARRGLRTPGILGPQPLRIECGDPAVGLLGQATRELVPPPAVASSPGAP